MTENLAHSGAGFCGIKELLLCRAHQGGEPCSDEAYTAFSAGIRPDLEYAAALKNIFFYLSLLFRYPDDRVYSEIREHLPVFSGFFLEYAGAVPSLPAIDELEAEHVSLFVNNRGFVPAAPYASCYTGDGLLAGEQYRRLRRIMAWCGFEMDGSARELEDHIAVMLELCSRLLDLMAAPADRGGKGAVGPALAFLELSYCFITPMLDQFTQNICAYARHDFYRCAARALSGFIGESDSIYSRLLGFS